LIDKDGGLSFCTLRPWAEKKLFPAILSPTKGN
jgi:hypothetical protein